MSQICLKIVSRSNEIKQEICGENEITFVYRGEYKEGDWISLEIEEIPAFYHIQLDDAKGSSLVYLTGNIVYEIPFGEKRANISKKVFAGDVHVLSVKKAYEEESQSYRILSENLWDQHGMVNCFPHASANVETRGELVFAALNAIDGVTASESHGCWPYESWGINQREDAMWRLEFGRLVEIDRILVYTRADFPHDNWWKKATIIFSDGTKETLDLKKSGEAQEFVIPKKTIEWLEFCDLIKADDPSPFPALTQLRVYGRG